MHNFFFRPKQPGVQLIWILKSGKEEPLYGHDTESGPVIAFRSDFVA